MSILILVVFGALVGWVASMIMGSPEGLTLDIAVGILGSVLGKFVMNMLGYGSGTGFNLYTFIVALLGACILIAIVGVIRRQ